MARLSLTLLVLVFGCLLVNELDAKRMIRVRPIRQKEGNTEVQNDSGNKRPDNVGGPIQEVVGPSDDNVDDSMEDLDDIADNDDIPDDSNKQQVVKDIEDEMESEEEEEPTYVKTIMDQVLRGHIY